jgi:aarF domain-containing kinase
MATSSSPTYSSFSSTFKPRERTVPSSPMERIAGFGQIASSIIFGTIKDKVTGAFSGGNAHAKNAQGEAPPHHPVDTRSAEARAGGPAEAPAADSTDARMNSLSSSPNVAAAGAGGASQGTEFVPPPQKAKPQVNAFLSEANTERLAEGLCRMRGAALKVGQMLSIQDESLVPPQLQAVLDRVRDGADVMPRKQLERALVSELGADWESRLAHFEWTPLAAASIGQVHAARLKDGREVVMKVQYPGVAESIHSDVNNLKRLIRFVNVLPRGM